MTQHPSSESRDLLTCGGVPYRQGFIEVRQGIHADHVNLEVWNVHPGTPVSDKLLSDLSDEAIVGNTEIELSVSQARALVERLRVALACLERANGDAEMP